jgi:diguanylate cyclase (GGDEF)-like protein
LRRQLRDSDVVARLGGDEFAALLPHGDLGSALQVAERIIESLAAMPPVPADAAFRVGVSIGVVGLDSAGTAEDLLVCADQAMYAAKETGRNRAVVHGADRTEYRAAP